VIDKCEVGFHFATTEILYSFQSWYVTGYFQSCQRGRCEKNGRIDLVGKQSSTLGTLIKTLLVIQRTLALLRLPRTLVRRLAKKDNVRNTAINQFPALIVGARCDVAHLRRLGEDILALARYIRRLKTPLGFSNVVAVANVFARDSGIAQARIL